MFERERRIVLGASLMGVTGEVQREGEVVHLITHEIEDQTAPALTLQTQSRARSVFTCTWRRRPALRASHKCSDAWRRSGRYLSP